MAVESEKDKIKKYQVIKARLVFLPYVSDKAGIDA